MARSFRRHGVAIPRLLVWLAALAFLMAGCRTAETALQAPAGAGPSVFLPIVMERQAPIATTSYYMKTVDSNILSVMGCGVGVQHSENPGPDHSGVILDFGTPVEVGEPVTDYGVTLFGFGPVTVQEVAVAVQYYAWGYYVCLGEDFSSHLTIGVGTNNYFGGDVTYEHGAAWAVMVNEVNDWLVANGYSGQVLAAGASDMELGWNTPTKTKNWLAGYDSANQWPLYNYGDAAGCPPAGQCGTASFPQWTVEDVWYISWGAPPSIPFPLIYANSGINATQWFLMSVYSYEEHGGRMDFAGAITQFQACQQRPSLICDLLDNTPEEGWNQLWERVNSDENTAQALPWVTDFKWYGE